MIFVTWNCNGALRRKLEAVDSLQADVVVIQECEDPVRSSCETYRAWASNYLWYGNNKNRGLGVFAKPHIKLTRAALDPAGLETFLPCWINDTVLLLAVWTREANSQTFHYIGQLWKFLQLHRATIAGNTTVLIGDLNSNVKWDKWDRRWNHSDVVRELAEIGLLSAYHSCRGIPQGGEPEPTFYLHRNTEKPYHIDYAFVPAAWLSQCSVEIGQPEQWLATSDHMPLRLQVRLTGIGSPGN